MVHNFALIINLTLFSTAYFGGNSIKLCFNWEASVASKEPQPAQKKSLRNPNVKIINSEAI